MTLIKHITLLFLIPTALAAQSNNDSLKFQNRSLHFQQTTIGQYHPPFFSAYSGTNSQVSVTPVALSLTSTFFGGRKLWHNGELYFDPEISGGKGVGQTLGIAGFPNGETYRIGDPEPSISIARLFIRQYINLKSNGNVKIEDDFNQLPVIVSDKRIVITAGKHSLTDIFDQNSYSHDPRTQFLNWALMSAGAWDYAANTKGYTISSCIELLYPRWSLKADIAMVPTSANGPILDLHIGKANSTTIEFDRNFDVHKKAGIIRLIAFYTNTHMGNYQLATTDTEYHHDITLTRQYGRTKLGFVLNSELAISDATGIFARVSYNDGNNETWAFTEIDRSVSAGISFKGIHWKRPDDVLGLAIAANGLSDPHKNYLAAGGYGFLIGDGRLNYGNESIFETYYNFKWGKYLFLSPDYQFVLNPAYNKDRGPVNLFALRAHVEF